MEENVKHSISTIESAWNTQGYKQLYRAVSRQYFILAGAHFIYWTELCQDRQRYTHLRQLADKWCYCLHPIRTWKLADSLLTISAYIHGSDTKLSYIIVKH